MLPPRIVAGTIVRIAPVLTVSVPTFAFPFLPAKLLLIGDSLVRCPGTGGNSAGNFCMLAYRSPLCIPDPEVSVRHTGFTDFLKIITPDHDRIWSRGDRVFFMISARIFSCTFI